MDGLTFAIPYQKVAESNLQLILLKLKENKNQDGFCVIKDWKEGKNVFFKDILAKRSEANEEK
ncbi:hypothetical protein [Ureaplasma diversum]|uniref:hypothetical protein n=1 Tax=Ureaplasma diversum TaxID=42094 RepID=UPI000A8C179C|nr:hypothetical protein [Ureaplasma diversum]